MATQKIKLGSVLQIKTSKGYAYAQLTHRHRLFGCLVRVFPGLHRTPGYHLNDLAKHGGSYSTFIFEEDLREEPTVKIVGHEAVSADAKQFPLFRDGVRDPRTKEVKIWWLWDGKKSWPIGRLKTSQKRLPIRQIWTYRLLAKRIASRWRPEKET